MHEDILGMWVTRLRCVAPLGCALLGHNTSIFAPFDFPAFDRDHRWAERAHFSEKSWHKATVLGLRWHDSFVWSSIMMSLPPGRSRQGV